MNQKGILYRFMSPQSTTSIEISKMQNVSNFGGSGVSVANRVFSFISLNKDKIHFSMKHAIRNKSMGTEMFGSNRSHIGLSY